MDGEQSREAANAAGLAAVRIRDLLKQIVPNHWQEAELDVVAVGEAGDHLCSIVGPIRNQDSDEKIHDLPQNLCDAIEDYCLATFVQGIQWKRCAIRLLTTKSGGKYFGADFSYD
jgi:hypothetical protein